MGQEPPTGLQNDRSALTALSSWCSDVLKVEQHTDANSSEKGESFMKECRKCLKKAVKIVDQVLPLKHLVNWTG